jgi:hypothetical protein
MARSWGRLVRVSAVAFVGALCAVVTSCRDFLGFQDAVVVQCLLDSDCPGTLVCNGTGVCTQQCATDKDCELGGRYPQGSTCTGGVCSLPEAAAPMGVVDASDVSDALDEPSSEGSQSETASNASEGGQCIPSCSEFSLCEAATCLSETDVGWSNPTGGQGIAEDGFLNAIQVPVDLCGFVTGIGFDLAVASDETYRFGLYTDNGGNPEKLVAQTASTPVRQGVNEAPVTQVVSLACELDVTYYWIVGTWNQNSVEFVTESTPVTKWVRVYVPNDSNDILAGGMPSSFPAGGTQLMVSQPHVYIKVAHR